MAIPQIPTGEMCTDNHPALKRPISGTEAYKPASTYTNSDIPIDSYGLDISIVKHWDNGYKLNLVYDYAKLDFDKEAHPDVFTYFNTPETPSKPR